MIACCCQRATSACARYTAARLQRARMRQQGGHTLGTAIRKGTRQPIRIKATAQQAYARPLAIRRHTAAGRYAEGYAGYIAIIDSKCHATSPHACATQPEMQALQNATYAPWRMCYRPNTTAVRHRPAVLWLSRGYTDETRCSVTLARRRRLACVVMREYSVTVVAAQHVTRQYASTREYKARRQRRNAYTPHRKKASGATLPRTVRLYHAAGISEYKKQAVGIPSANGTTPRRI